MIPNYKIGDRVYNRIYKSPAIIQKMFRPVENHGIFKIFLTDEKKCIWCKEKYIMTLEESDPGFSERICHIEAGFPVARFNFNDKEINIVIPSRDKVKEPHFHVFTCVDDYNNFDGSAISMISNRAVHHPGRNNKALSKEEFNIVIHTILKDSVWDYMVYWWNDQNENSKIDNLTCIPNYNYDSFEA